MTSVKKKSVFVLVLNWNNWKDTNECLSSLQGLEYDNFKTIVLDNGSTDESVRCIRAKFPNVEVMELCENLGFAKGYNAGIQVALFRGADYVWLLNNDTTVDPRALCALVEKAETNPSLGVIGSAIYHNAKPECLQAWGGGYISFSLGRSRHFLQPVPDEAIEFLTGASFLLRRPVLETLGFLDEEFFLYWEDADYCFRVRKAGWRLGVAGDSKVWHKENATIGKQSEKLDFHFNKSAVYFYKKYARMPLIPISVSIAARLTKRLMLGDWKRLQAVWAGARHAALSLASARALYPRLYM